MASVSCQICRDAPDFWIALFEWEILHFPMTDNHLILLCKRKNQILRDLILKWFQWKGQMWEEWELLKESKINERESLNGKEKSKSMEEWKKENFLRLKIWERNEDYLWEKRLRDERPKIKYQKTSRFQVSSNINQLKQS